MWGLLLIVTCSRGKVHGPCGVSRCAPSPWSPWSGPGKARGPSQVHQCLFTNIFQAWARERYSLFFDQRATRMCTQGSYVFYSHGGSWSERMTPTGRDSKAGDGERAPMTRVQLIRCFQGLAVHLQICEPIPCSLINKLPQKQSIWAARLSLRLPNNTDVNG